MNDVPLLEHALYGGQDAGGYRFLAQSPGFLDEWLPEAERLCTGFGERPTGIMCRQAVFAQAFATKYVAIGQVNDRGFPGGAKSESLLFRLFVVDRKSYIESIGDPFLLS